MTMIFDIDKSDKNLAWKLYRVHSRRYDGEIYLVYKSKRGLLFQEQSDPAPEDSELLGELKTTYVQGRIVDEVIPFRRRSEREQQQLLVQVEQHKIRRPRAHASYPLEQRLKDLSRS